MMSVEEINKVLRKVRYVNAIPNSVANLIDSDFWKDYMDSSSHVSWTPSMIEDVWMDRWKAYKLHRKIKAQYVDPDKMVGIPIQSAQTPTTLRSGCDCGAGATSFPNAHYGWCSMMERA